MCLGAAAEIALKVNEDDSFLFFIEKILIPYLYAHRYFLKLGKMPFGERGHGVKGVLQYYKELLPITDPGKIIRLLNLIAARKIRGHLACPCGSNLKFRDCHWNVAIKLKNIPLEIIRQDIKLIENLLKAYQL